MNDALLLLRILRPPQALSAEISFTFPFLFTYCQDHKDTGKGKHRKLSEECEGLRNEGFIDVIHREERAALRGLFNMDPCFLRNPRRESVLTALRVPRCKH